MTKKEISGSQDSFAETCSSVISGTISFFLFLLMMVFPLIYHNSYIDILETKYQTYYLIILGMLAVLLVLGIVMLIIDRIEFKGAHAVELFSGLLPKNWRKTFCLADGAVLVFWLVALISTLQSDYVFESFWGNEGRYTGLFLISLYVAAYFVISRFWQMKGWIVEVFLISGMIMCVIGITDYFQLDVLDFRGNIKPEQSTIFTSTVGNINTYTAYVGLVMGMSAALFATAKSRIRIAWYYICMVMTFFAIIMGCSDNAYLAIGALFAFLPFVLFQNRKGILRYLVMVASFATVIQCIDYLNQAFADIVIGLDSLFKILVNFRGLLPAVILLWAVTLGFWWFVVRGRAAGGQRTDGGHGGVTATAGTMGMAAREGNEFGKRYVRLWGIFVAAGLLAVCFMIFDANALGNGARYGGLSQYLVFSDSWGTNRGYIWKASIRLYKEFPLMHKLFGYGPDTFGILTKNNIYLEMLEATRQSFDSAHNEYLQYLITIGPIGLVAYLVFLISAGRDMLRCVAKNPYAVGCLSAVLCYGVQALVNLNLPIATPVMWGLLSVGMAIAVRQRRE